FRDRMSIKCVTHDVQFEYSIIVKVRWLELVVKQPLNNPVFLVVDSLDRLFVVWRNVVNYTLDCWFRNILDLKGYTDLILSKSINRIIVPPDEIPIDIDDTLRGRCADLGDIFDSIVSRPEWSIVRATDGKAAVRSEDDQGISQDLQC